MNDNKWEEPWKPIPPDIKREFEEAWNEAARARMAAWARVYALKRERIGAYDAEVMRRVEDDIWAPPGTFPTDPKPPK